MAPTVLIRPYALPMASLAQIKAVEDATLDAMVVTIDDRSAPVAHRIRSRHGIWFVVRVVAVTIIVAAPPTTASPACTSDSPFAPPGWQRAQRRHRAWSDPVK